jgi:L-aminopeptidase/D-esterase-like protein
LAKGLGYARGLPDRRILDQRIAARMKLCTDWRWNSRKPSSKYPKAKVLSCQFGEGAAITVLRLASRRNIGWVHLPRIVLADCAWRRERNRTMNAGSVLLSSIVVGLAAAVAGLTAAHADQGDLVPKTALNGPTLKFDWPAIEVGIGSYEEGPTGVTIVRFPKRASVVVDVRGGSPGTVNTDGLRLGYGFPFTDAIVFSGGSGYGEEAVTAVMTGLKDSARSGQVAVASGAVINDFGPRRLNDIYPDKRLAQAALRDLRPGVFPLGAQGAGRMAMQGGYFGCDAHAGQGAAYRQIGNVKIVAFTVVNSSGVLTDRDGRLVVCNKAKSWETLTRTADLLQNLPASIGTGWKFAAAETDEGLTKNTVLSLIVTNQKLDYASLQRLAVQVHTSMARGIQPFQTQFNGDTLFAASTQEVENKDLSPTNLTTVAGEVMWDALLASVPAESVSMVPTTPVTVAPDALASFVGKYRFGVPPDPVSTQPRTGQEFGGLGVELAIEDGSVKVLAAYDDTPAARAGLIPGDVISRLDGQPLQGLAINQVLERMRGPVNSEVRLTIVRSGRDGATEIALTRAIIQLPLSQLEVRVVGGKLMVESTGALPVFEFGRRRPIAVQPMADAEFYVEGRYHTRIAFTKDPTTGKVSGAVLNPGRWQQKGVKVG